MSNVRRIVEIVRGLAALSTTAAGQKVARKAPAAEESRTAKGAITDP